MADDNIAKIVSSITTTVYHYHYKVGNDYDMHTTLEYTVYLYCLKFHNKKSKQHKHIIVLPSKYFSGKCWRKWNPE